MNMTVLTVLHFEEETASLLEKKLRDFRKKIAVPDIKGGRGGSA